MVVKIMVPFWVPQKIRCRIIIGTQKGTIILTSTHIGDCIGDTVSAILSGLYRGLCRGLCRG